MTATSPYLNRPIRELETTVLEKKQLRDRQIANERLAERQRQNSPWPRKIASLPHPATEGENKTQETGTRTLVRCNMPVRDGIEECRIVNDAERQLAERFGGFTRLPMQGTWLDTQGNVVTEHGFVYEVSVHSPQDRYSAIEAFKSLGRALGEEWTHITTALETAHHTKTG